MPDTLALTVSTGVSFGLLAGIVSGVCYLVANGFTWPGGRERRVRGGSGGEAGRSDSGVCGGCGREVEDSEDYDCICEETENSERAVKFEEGRWFLKQVQRTLKYIPWSLSTDKLDSIGRKDRRRGSVPARGSAAREARSVRDFMEQLSERLAGGALDRTSVASMYNHPDYESMFSRHHATLRDALVTLGLALRGAITNLPAVRDGEPRAEPEQPSASGAHARLKRLVQRVIEEAMTLPALAHYAHHHEPADASAFDARTYEDLLATAILNKVIERYQTESTGGRSAGASSGIHSASASPTPSAPSSSSTSPPHSPHTPPPLHDDDDNSDSEWEHHDGREEAPELPRRVPFPEFGGDIIHYSESLGELDDHTLEEMSGSDLQAVDGTWEENWLFQRKKVKTMQSVPVPMLVPNSNTDYKAMIGDRDADDTTDLSDAATDTEEEIEYKSDIGRALESKTVIGGKIPTEQLITIEASDETINSPKTKEESLNGTFEYDSNESQNMSNNTDSSTEVQEVTAEFNSSNDSVMVVGIDSGPLSKAEFAVDEIHRTNPNPVNVDDVDGIVSTVNTVVVNKESTNSMSNHQKDGEYEETITKPVQRYADSLRRQHYPNGDNTDADETNGNAFITNSGDDLIPGSIADRERKKWLNYVDMPNNPYSAEAIKKRLNNKSTSAAFDFLTTKTTVEDKASINTSNNTDETRQEDSKEKSPSPRVLKDVLAEEVPQYKRYGRDYYINEAKRSAGARRSNLSSASSLSSINKSTSLDQFDTNEITSPGLLIKQFNSMASVKENETNCNNNPTVVSNTTNIQKNNEKEMVSIENEDISEQSLFSAKPVFIEDNTDEKFEDLLKSADMHGNTQQVTSRNVLNLPAATSNGVLDESLLSSSSLDDSIKIYNVPTGEIVKNSRDQHSTGSDSMFDIDNIDNIVISDKNTEEGNSGSTKNDLEMPVASSDEKMINGSENMIDFQDVQLPKVKDLAKKFVKIDNVEELQPPKSIPRRRKFSNDYELEVVNKSDQKLSGKHASYMHSLTARSISKEFREELKFSMATPLKVPGGANEVPEGMDDVTRENCGPGSPVPIPGTLKNKLAFFESLKF